MKNLCQICKKEGRDLCNNYTQSTTCPHYRRKKIADVEKRNYYNWWLNLKAKSVNTIKKANKWLKNKNTKM